MMAAADRRALRSHRCARLLCLADNHTFLNNGEAHLGFHLRRSGLRCRDVRTMRPSVHLLLPATRKRDWGPHTLGMG